MIEFFDEGGVVVEFLVGERPRAPCGRVAVHGDQVLYTIWNAVQRAPIVSGGNIGCRGSRLLQRQIARNRGIGVEFWSQALAARKKTFREFDGRNFARANLVCQFGYGQKEDVVAE